MHRKDIPSAAVGIELKGTLKTRKLLIPLNAKNAKNSEFAQVRYTPGTRAHQILFNLQRRCEAALFRQADGQ